VCGRLLGVALAERFVIVVSPTLLGEFARVLARPKFRRYMSEDEALEIVARITQLAEPAPEAPALAGVTPDPKDDYLVALARAAYADYLVSGDSHLTCLPNPKPRVLTPRMFLTLLEQTAVQQGDLIVSDEVREVLSTAGLETAVRERAIAHRQHTHRRCVICAKHIEDLATVLMCFDDDDHATVYYAHPECSPSRLVRGIPPSRPRISYQAILRSHPIPGVLVWEPIRVSIDLDHPETRNVAAYRERGFQPSEAGLENVAGPELAGWVLYRREGDLVLNSPSGDLEEFSDVTSHAQPRWFEAVAASRRCLLIMGETLGLDRLSETRISALLADGRAVAAVIPCTGVTLGAAP